MSNFDGALNPLCDSDFIKLRKMLGTFSSFEVLNIESSENKNSNILAWLFDENNNHNLGRNFLDGCLKVFFSSTIVPQEKFEILREANYIDLLLISNKNIIVIENKIFTEDHNDQLQRYRKLIIERYPEKEHLFIYLTPNGSPPRSKEEDEYWNCVSHLQLIEVIKELSDFWLESDAKNFIIDFIDSMETHVLKVGRKHSLAQKIVEKWPYYFDYSSQTNSIAVQANSAEAKVLKFIRKYYAIKIKGNGFFSSKYLFRESFTTVFQSVNIEVMKMGDSQSTYFGVLLGNENGNEAIPVVLSFRYLDKKGLIKFVGYIQPESKSITWNKNRQKLFEVLPELCAAVKGTKGKGKYHISFFSRDIPFDIEQFSSENLDDSLLNWLNKNNVLNDVRKIENEVNKILSRNVVEFY